MTSISRRTALASLITVVLTASAVVSAAPAVAAATPKPLAGTYHFTRMNQPGGVTSGEFRIGTGRSELVDLTFVPYKDTGCGTTRLTIHRAFKLVDVPEDFSTQTNWALRKNDATVRVTVTQGTKTFRANLALDLGSKNGTTHPVKYVFGSLDEGNNGRCNITLSGQHTS